ncbi:hypothetical protein SSOG_03294 [Streptomyces himastatinicus ATCC 53653]|uniref:Uncharacterized protein n=1 Tax=Streptomyces himastatinicus ATCC 53653 TaxID=457427 RepID=D9WK17_9ACTN|nr:hypothetical protein [Streptomyces himastatinicus]EFL23580.1 hypothetical protein SSOG_03294 [Streptomyces himastatinicus ATCC 53653]
MDAASSITLYLARRDAYAEFLSAADAESNVAWFRKDGRFSDGTEAVAAVDRAYAATRAAFNVIDVEGIGPVKEARTVLEQLAAMHRDGGVNPDWKDFKAARESFVVAANRYLKGMRGED